MTSSTPHPINSSTGLEGKSKLARCARLAAWVGLWLGGLFLAHEVLDLMVPEGMGLSGDVSWLFGQTMVLVMILLGLWVVTPGLPKVRWRGMFSLSIWALLIAIGHHFSHQELYAIRETFEEARTILGPQGLLVCVLIYGLLLAMPFVPGIEVGLLLMAAFGLVGVVMVYVGTVLGLCLAFCFGRFVPEPLLNRWMATLGFNGRDEPSGMLRRVGGAGGPLAFLSRNRYLALAVLINMPGNTLLGGGGGISLICGAARWMPWPGFIATVVLATAPVPLLVGLGFIQLDGMLQ